MVRVNFVNIYSTSCIIASQMWLLGRLIPFMFGEKVSEDDKHWKNYLLLLRITDCLFAPVVSTIYLKVTLLNTYPIIILETLA